MTACEPTTPLAAATVVAATERAERGVAAHAVGVGRGGADGGRGLPLGGQDLN